MPKLTRQQKAAISRTVTECFEKVDVDIERHSRICSICRHPLAALINESFLQWMSPYSIIEQFHISSRGVLYHHAHVFNLFELRDRTLRRALGNIIEQSDRVRPTARDIINAACAFAHINEEGMWVQPVSVSQTQVIVSPDGAAEALAGPSTASQSSQHYQEIRRLPAKPRTRRRRTFPQPPKARSLYVDVISQPIDPEYIDCPGFESRPFPNEVLPSTHPGVENESKH